MRAPTRSVRAVIALVMGAVLAACTEGTGPGSLGQLRVRPVFAPGEDPAVLGVSLTQIHMVLRRPGGTIVADTVLPYVAGETTSWLIDLENPPESVDMNAQIGQGAATMYAGADTVPLPEGIGQSSTAHDLLVRFLGGPNATFTVDVSPDSATLHSSGATQQYTAVARDAGGAPLTGFTFTWSSSRPDIATVDANSGLVTAVSNGRAIITATTGGVAGTAVANVGPPGGGVPFAIVVTPPQGLLSLLGDTLRFIANAIDVNGNPMPGVVTTWSSTNPTVATVSAQGVATAVSPGQTFIIASSGSVADSAFLVVVDGGGPGAASIVVTPATATLTSVGATQQFTAVARDAQGNILTGITFQWSSSNTAVAIVDANGRAAAIANGVVTITASANGVTGSASLTVALGPPGPPAFILVTPGAVTLTAIGNTQQFAAVALDANGRVVPGVAFAWSSSNPAIAPVNSTGLVTAAAPGAVTITASASGLSGSAAVTVAQVVHSIVVTPPAASILATESTTFSAIARDANGHIIPGAVFAWLTANPAVATVNSAGVATGVGGGTTQVIAASGSVFASGTLSVTVVGSIQILGAQESHLKVGLSTQFTAEVRDVAGNLLTGVAVTWSVTKPAVASIDPVTGVATGLTAGVTRVRASIANLFDEVELVIRP